MASNSAAHVPVQQSVKAYVDVFHLDGEIYVEGIDYDVVLAADCVAFAMGNFHQDYLKGKGLAIACPKLDSGLDSYMQKLTSMIDDAKINTLTVMIMQVPCCSGMLQMAKASMDKASRKVPLKAIVVGLEGEILSEEWV